MGPSRLSRQSGVLFRLGSLRCSVPMNGLPETVRAVTRQPQSASPGCVGRCPRGHVCRGPHSPLASRVPNGLPRRPRVLLSPPGVGPSPLAFLSLPGWWPSKPQGLPGHGGRHMPAHLIVEEGQPGLSRGARSGCPPPRTIQSVTADLTSLLRAKASAAPRGAHSPGEPYSCRGRRQTLGITSISVFTYCRIVPCSCRRHAASATARLPGAVGKGLCPQALVIGRTGDRRWAKCSITGDRTTASPGYPVRARSGSRVRERQCSEV